MSTYISGIDLNNNSSTKTTWIVADGQLANPTTILDEAGIIATGVLRGNDPPAGRLYHDTRTDLGVDYVSDTDDDLTLRIQNTNDCLTWVAQVLAVELKEMCNPIDVKPGSCPNPPNVKCKGILPVAILGTDILNVNDIDPDSIKLEGTVSPIEVLGTYDVSQPFVGELEDCDSCVSSCDIIDERLDLLLKFDRQEVVAALGSVDDEYCLEVEVTGTLLDGTTSLTGALAKYLRFAYALCN